MAITKIILQQMVAMDQNSITASKYPKYTVVLSNSISSITAGELTTAIESSKASAAAAKQSEINAKQSELNAKDSENEAEISAASSQQSATQSASSATASANSAKAAKTSETNAKASETAAKTSETNAKASETAAKTSETNANSSKTAAAASASAAKTSEINAAASASAAKTSETNANSSKTAAANSANAAKASETNAKTSEINAAASATKAENVASGMKASIGLGSSARHIEDITVEPVGFLGFIRILRSTTVGYPTAASGENVLAGFIAPMDGSPGYIGLFIGDVTGTPYSYRWTKSTGAIWWRGVLDSQINRYFQLPSGETQIKSGNGNYHLYINDLQGWGAYDNISKQFIPLAVAKGGTGGRSASEARTNLGINRLEQIADDQTRLYAGNNTTYLEVGNNRAWGVYNRSSNSWQPLGVAQGGTGAMTAEDARTNLGLGRSSSPTFGHLQLLTENDSAQASSGILSQFLRDTSGAQRARSRIYSEIRGDNKAWLTLHLQSDANTNKYAGLSIDGNFQINGNFIGNAISLSDVATSKVNLQVNRFVQATGETDIVNHAGTAQIFITDNKNWGAYDKELKRHIALPITQGGTGSLSISEAKTNLQIPSVGAGDWMEIAAPAGVEAGKYYPIIIKAQYASLYASGFFIDIQTRSSSGSDPMNCCAFNGFIRTGGWSDRKDAGYGYYNRYGSSELALKCILVSAKNAEDNIAVYVEGRAFPVKMRIPQFCTATAVASASTYGEVTFAWGTSNPATDSVGVNALFDFSLNRVGFYQASTEGNYYIGNGQRIVLSNGMSVGDELTLTTPKITFSGTVAAGNGFIADGTSVSNATFYSRYRVGDTVYGAEFRASENAAQVIVRDPAGTSHQFFNFNLNGTFSPPNGLLTSTGTDWNGQKNTINKFYGIAGSDNAPENAIYGGVHVGFSGNYATQFAGRNSKFWVRSIEAGESKEWLKLITATLAPKIPTDARDGFISDNAGDPSWAPSNGGGFQSSYAENRIMQGWVDGAGRLYSRFLTTNQPTTPKTDVPWKSAAMLEMDNRFTGSNTFLGDILCSAANPLTLTSANPTLSFVESDADNSTYMFVSDGGSFRLNRDNTTGAEIFNYSRSQNNLKFGVSSYFTLNTRFDQGWTSRGSVDVTTSGYSGIAITTTASTDSVGARNLFEVSPDKAFYLARRNRSNNTGQWIINFPTAGGTLALSGTSDINYKTNIEEYDGIRSIENIKAMDLVTFVFKDDEKQRTRRGVIAQQIEQIDPTYVKHTYEPCGEPIVDDDGVVQGYTDTKERVVLDNNVLLLDALCAIKVLAQRDEEKTERINKLEKDVEDLKTVVEHLLTAMKNS